MNNDEMISYLAQFLGSSVAVAKDRETLETVGIALTMAQVERVMIGLALAEQMLRSAVVVEMPPSKEKPST